MFILTPRGTLVNLDQINEVTITQSYSENEFAVIAYGMPTSNEDFRVEIWLFVSSLEKCEQYFQSLCKTLGAIDTAGYEQPMVEAEPAEKQGFLEAKWDNELPF